MCSSSKCCRVTFRHRRFDREGLIKSKISQRDAVSNGAIDVGGQRAINSISRVAMGVIRPRTGLRPSPSAAVAPSTDSTARTASPHAPFLTNPRKRTFINPNWRLITRNGCSTWHARWPCGVLLRIAALRRPSGNFAMSLGRAVCATVGLRAALRPAHRGSPSQPTPAAPLPCSKSAICPTSDLLAGVVVTVRPSRCRHRRRCAPSSQSATGYPSWSGAFRSRFALGVLGRSAQR